MKTKTLFALFAVAAMAAVTACNKASDSTPPRKIDNARPIQFSANGDDFQVSTKVTAVTSMDGGFNVLYKDAYFNTSEPYYYVSLGKLRATKNGTTWVLKNTDTNNPLYWPTQVSPAHESLDEYAIDIDYDSYAFVYNFYCSNMDVYYRTSWGMYDPVFDTGITYSSWPFFNQDILLAIATNQYNSTVNLTFNHLLARIGTITVNAQSGYTISNIGVRIFSYGSDYAQANDNIVYDPVIGEFKFSDEEGERGVLDYSFTDPSFGVTRNLSSGSNDVYIQPGTHQLLVSYTLTKGDYTESFTKSGEVTLQAGKINNITCTAVGGNAQEVQFSVNVQNWTSTTLTPTLS